MYKLLYFKTPTFGKEKWEEKIVNELGCSLYNIVKKQRYFESDKYLVIMNKNITIVYCDILDKESQKKVREVFYKKKWRARV